MRSGYSNYSRLRKSMGDCRHCRHRKRVVDGGSGSDCENLSFDCRQLHQLIRTRFQRLLSLPQLSKKNVVRRCRSYSQSRCHSADDHCQNTARIKPPRVRWFVCPTESDSQVRIEVLFQGVLSESSAFRRRLLVREVVLQGGELEFCEDKC